MTTSLVLSLFPGIGLLDRGFEDEGFAVVRGPDLLWGGDIKKFNAPAGRFDGVIGGPPCQRFSRLAKLVEHVHGPGALAPNLIPEYERVVSEAAPSWFLMENVPEAPEPVVAGYEVRSLVLNNRWFPDVEGSSIGAEQNRKRRFSLGTRDGRRLLPHAALFECPRTTLALTATGGGVRLQFASAEAAKSNGGCFNEATSQLVPCGTVTANATTWDAEKNRPRSTRSEAYFREACRLQGLPENFDLPGFAVSEKIRAVGNGVPYPLARAVARAVKEAMQRGSNA